jgi:uncharacterized protein
MPFILEGIVTTLDDRGGVHVAPMGPQVEGPVFTRFELRPYPSSQTFQNLKRRGEGVLHVTDDVLLLARAAIGAAGQPACEPATAIRGFVLADCCRYYEFRATAIDELQERVRIHAEVVHIGRRRDFFGFNRGKHAVVEAAILATRTRFLPAEQIAAEFARLQVLVEKTGGPAEHEAFRLLSESLANAQPSP